MAQYRFDKKGKPKTAFVYKWNTVQWDLVSRPIYSCRDIADILKKRFGRYWKVDNRAIEQYFIKNKFRNLDSRWPSLGVCDSKKWGECKHGLSEANLQKVIEVFEANTYPINYKESASNSEPPRKNCLPTTKKNNPLFTQFEDWEIVKDGLTTPEAAEYLNTCGLGRTYDADAVKDMCRDGRIPSAKIGDRHKVHKTSLDELVAEARRLKPAPAKAEDKPEKKDIDQLLAARLEWEKSMERRFDILERAVAELKRQMVEEFSRANEREERRFADTNARVDKVIANQGDTDARVDEVSKKQTLTSSWLRENFSPEWKGAGDEHVL